MAVSFYRRSLSAGVARRVLTLFFLAAVLPMFFTAGLAFYEFNRGLENEASRSLQENAKKFGVEILVRLELIAEKSAEVIRKIETDGPDSVKSYDFLLKDFSAIWTVTNSGQTVVYYGSELPDESDEVIFANSIPEGQARLLLTEANQLIMLREIDEGSDSARVIAFLLKASNIWGLGENLPYGTDFCVFSETGKRLHCTSDVNQNIHAALGDVSQEKQGSAFASWVHEGEAHFAALWQLSLNGSYGAPPLDIVAMQPNVIAMQSGADFRRVFVPGVLLVLVLVGLVSQYFIRRTLGPLQDLTVAAKELASGKLDSRVEVQAGDEFGRLAEAFNNMADRIGHQISALEAMSGIDKMILTGTKIEEVSEDVVAHLTGLTNCDMAAVIARDTYAPEIGKMISLYAGSIYHDRVQLPGDIVQQWCKPRQVALDNADAASTPYAGRFKSFGQNYVILIPVVLHKALKGVLLLGFSKEFDIAQFDVQRIVDLASRFAVALASVERERTLYRQAHFDQLTGLPNRQLLKDRLSQYLSKARQENHSGALLFLDLDRFKEINDVFGHSVGDGVLTQASKRIVAEVRDRDTVSRLGGDEFVVVLPNVRNDQIVRGTAERLLASLGEAFNVSGTDHYLSASIGIAMFPDDGATVETILKNADSAMYRAKEAGRGRFEFFSKRLNAESRRKIGIERDLRVAFQNGDLDIHFQPQFEVATGNLSGAEALLRWTHAERGPISPAEFIPLAEDSELIVDIGSWALQKTCENLSSILSMDLHPGPMSINVSARQLADSSFSKAVMDPIHRFGINPGYIQLEVTETTVAQNRDKAIAILQSLREDGVRVAIDDFGTGYSSLSYLQQMPFDALKIDKSFVDRIGSNITSDNICRTIITMAEQLGKKSIAEGVEVQSQIDFLRENGCDSVQGFYYSVPLPLNEFVAFIEKLDFHTQRRKALEIA